MKRLLTAGCVLLAFGCSHPESTVRPTPPVRANEPSQLTQLETALRARIAQVDSATIAVSLIDIATGRELHINGDTVFHAASTMKVPVLLELYHRADHEPGFLEKKVPVTNSFKSIADTSHFVLDPGDDSDSTVYKLIGDSADLRFLAHRMIVRSSNFATNLLIDVLGAMNIRSTLANAGITGVQVLRGVEDTPAFQRGLNNTMTSRGLALTLDAIARCTITSRKSCDEMVQILSEQEFNEMIPAGLPAGTKVAHKTGWITKVQHDGAIVYPPNRAPYILVVLTKGIGDTKLAAQTVADLSRIVWQTVTSPAWARVDLDVGGKSGELANLQLHNRVGEIARRRFNHSSYWQAVDSFTNGRKEKLGESAEGRPIYLVTFGHGPTKVLLWSQMHGDESTATMALADLMRYLHTGNDARVNSWSDKLTLLMVPMLNPDGAEWFVRHNAYGIDVNRDARTLATPEARILKAVRDRFNPEFGFNLHDQNARTRVGDTGALAAIALLAPAPDSSGKVGATQLRAQQVAAVVRDAIEPLVGGHVTKYDDTFNPRAFGDNIQRWGTSTVLIESGGWKNDPEKQFLRTVNFVALAAAFDAIASGDYAQADVSRYQSLLMNGENAVDLVIKGGTLVVPGLAGYRADISIVGNDFGSGSVTEIGDLSGVVAKDTLDVSGMFVHPARDRLRRVAPPPSTARLLPNAPAFFTVRRGDTESSDAVYIVEGLKITKLTESDLRPAGEPHNAVGCYEINVGPSTPPGRGAFNSPAKIQLQWTNGVEMFERGRLLVRALPGQPETRWRFMYWAPVSENEIAVNFGTGFGGITMRLKQAGTSWKGTGTFTSDAITVGVPDPTAPVVLTRINCP